MVRCISCRLTIGIIFVFTVVGVIAVFYFHVNRVSSGYCSKENRYPSDEERVRSAIEYVLRTFPPDNFLPVLVNGNVVIRPVPLKAGSSYRDVEDFMIRNPECCTITDSDPSVGRPQGLWLRWSGAFYDYVRVHYIVSYIEQGHAVIVPYTEYVPLDVCADVADLN